MGIGRSSAQTEDEFLPPVTMLAIDSTEDVAIRFCKQIVSVVPAYHIAFADKEDILLSKYVYDNGNFETLKLEFQFKIENVQLTDTLGNVSTVKNRVVRLQKISADLPTITKIYNYLFNTAHTPDKIMVISNKDKAVSYNGSAFNSTLVADDYKPGYWIITFYKI